MSYDDQQKILEDAISNVWIAVEETANRYRQKDKKITFNGTIAKFKTGFIERYNKIMNGYMKDDVRELDRHKIVAIMIIVCIEDQIITYTGRTDRLISLAPYTIAVEAGLNWMIKGLNRELSKANCNCTPGQYFMPTAFTCPTPYFDIFCRNLYYAETHWNGLNPLDIAERLYLLEYITLQQNRIDPEILKSYNKK